MNHAEPDRHVADIRKRRFFPPEREGVVRRAAQDDGDARSDAERHERAEIIRRIRQENRAREQEKRRDYHRGRVEQKMVFRLEWKGFLPPNQVERFALFAQKRKQAHDEHRRQKADAGHGRAKPGIHRNVEAVFDFRENNDENEEREIDRHVRLREPARQKHQSGDDDRAAQNLELQERIGRHVKRIAENHAHAEQAERQRAEIPENRAAAVPNGGVFGRAARHCPKHPDHAKPEHERVAFQCAPRHVHRAEIRQRGDDISRPGVNVNQPVELCADKNGKEAEQRERDAVGERIQALRPLPEDGDHERERHIDRNQAQGKLRDRRLADRARDSVEREDDDQGEMREERRGEVVNEGNHRKRDGKNHHRNVVMPLVIQFDGLIEPDRPGHEQRQDAHVFMPDAEQNARANQRVGEVAERRDAPGFLADGEELELNHRNQETEQKQQRPIGLRLRQNQQAGVRQAPHESERAEAGCAVKQRRDSAGGVNCFHHSAQHAAHAPHQHEKTRVEADDERGFRRELQ